MPSRSFRESPRANTSMETLTRSTRRMIPLRSQVGFNANQQNHRPMMPHEVDHNYGERRHPVQQPLSRHQRNVDELENQDERESLSSRLRHRTLVNSSNITAAAASSIQTLQTSPRRPTRSTRSQIIENNSDSDDDNTPLNIVASSSRMQTISTDMRTTNQSGGRLLRQRRQILGSDEVSSTISSYFFFKKLFDLVI